MMSREMSAPMENNDIIEAITFFPKKVGLKDVKMTFDTRTKTACVVGNKDGLQYTTTLKEYMGGCVEIKSKFDTNLGKEGMKMQVSELKAQGYTQQKIADMLGISQSTVSNYLKKQ